MPNIPPSADRTEAKEFFPQLRTARLGGISSLRSLGESMRDVHAILRDKELDLERTRREIQALLVVIPLLAEEQSLSENVVMNVPAVLPAPAFTEPPFMEPAFMEPAFMESARKPQQKEPFSQLLTSWLSGKKI